MNENVIEFLRGQKTATVTFSQRRYINRIKKLAKKRPDECEIKKINSDGSIVAHIPTKWIRINPPRVIILSEEERIKRRERFLQIIKKEKRE